MARQKHDNGHCDSGHRPPSGVVVRGATAKTLPHQVPDA